MAFPGGAAAKRIVLEIVGWVLVVAGIAALILFSFGSGPIKGFAVTMCIGVMTSYFSALMLTRLIIMTWLRWAKPKVIKA